MSREKKKRTSPQTGEHIRVAQAKRALLEIKKAERELEREDELLLLDPATGLPERVEKKIALLTYEHEKEYKDATSADIVARTLEDLVTIQRVAGASKGLKGSLAGALREAAARTHVSITILTTRAYKSQDVDSVDSDMALDVTGRQVQYLWD